LGLGNKVNWSRLNAYRVWKPLGLLVGAGLTPPDREVTLIDENLGHPDYGRLPKPDLVGVTAFTSQAPRAYEVAAVYRAMGVPEVTGGIHATFCRDGAMEHADAVVTGEEESVWGQVLTDARECALQRYMSAVSAAWTRFRLPGTTCSRDGTISARFKPRAAVR
jgi:signal transduction protein with GAF and PtsI domain